ncbi:AI-2E family transporter [Methylocystis bryophila]|uniref:AI-2E family transporter n=1 Tax=Methylocystis bryophila TaxID=655015 RepID=A0A1W6N0D0_9HYPH|nr:AI-2E family transporter [Methylocystis bryophila]ARN83285.1 AI-2E family transporter [Methylocystis bryophila]BDV39938.1 hypothetical protein DSM21852_31910 [Methylocystis bryophila]
MRFNFNTQDSGSESFVYRAIVVAGVAAVAAALLWILWHLKDLIPTVFATILLAVGWRGAGESLSKRFGLSIGISLALVALGLAGVVALAFSLFGGDLLKQYDEIAIDVPTAIAMIEGSVEAHPWGEFVEKLIAGVDFSKATGPVAMHIAAILTSFGSALAFAVFAIIGAAYLAADPDTHVSGLTAFAPAARRAQIARFLDGSAASLRQWLVIQVYVVLMNAVFAGVALWAFGVPAALALASISGALAFIPYFGSIIAIVVTALVALPHGLGTAALAALAVGGASFLEGYLITPFLQSRSLSVPPAVLLFCMLAFGTLFGSMGVALAVPATVVLAVALNAFKSADPT